MSRLSVLAILLALLVSCSESSLLAPEMSEDEEINIATVNDGELIGPTGSIPVSVEHHVPEESSQEALDYLLIELHDDAGAILASTEVEAPAAVEIPPVELPELEPGRYTVTFTVFRNDESLRSVERNVFVVVDPSAYDISGIATYPPSLVKGQKGVAQASVSVPQEEEVWLRWKLEGNVIHEAYLADGGGQVTIEAPAEAGAYTLAVELFPHGEVRGDYEGPAPVARESRLFVRAQADGQERSLGPPEEYFALFHFDGSTEDNGVGSELTGGEPFEVETLGSPKLRVSDRVFGYELDGNSGFEISQLLVPFRGGAPSRFSLNIRLRLDGLSGEQQIIALHSREEQSPEPQSAENQANQANQASDTQSSEPQSPDNQSTTVESAQNEGSVDESSQQDFSLELSVDENGTPTLELTSKGTVDTSTPREPIFTAGEPVNVSIGIVPRETDTHVRWYADGRYVSESLLSVGFPKTQSNGAWTTRRGVTTIGGENGFRGILDELGVYFRDSSGNASTYSDMFRHAREREFGSALVYAEGFDGTGLPADVDIDGSVRTEQGMLVLEAGSTAELPPISWEENTLIFEMQLPESTNATPPMVDFAQSGSSLFSVDAAGELSDWTGASESFSADSSLWLRLALEGDTLVVSSKDTELRVPLRREPLDELEPRLRGPTASGVSRVESILIYDDTQRVASLPQGDVPIGVGADDGVSDHRDNS